MTLRERLVEYARLVRLDRPVGIYLLLWPTLWALWIAADGWPPLDILLIFVAGVTLMRSAGCAINDFADRHIDAHVERTRSRPLARGSIQPYEAVAVFLVLSAIAFVLVLLTNPLTVAFALVAVVLAATYPFMKRFHSLPQVHLGAAFAWAVPMAFTAVTNELPPPIAWLLFVTTLTWTVVYDTFYGMVDRKYDLAIGVRSTAILFGEQDRLITGILQGLVWLGLYLVGQQAGFGGVYLGALGLVALLMFYQQFLIFDREPEACFRAFRNNHYLGLVVLAGMVADTLLGGG
ncbi:4-hydroxybenzoate octaprenyltransferase [Thioalkalivibrio paradoxus]|uniref:4-hydroxybenzoate octaprenyltransferase n=1 Tax=Thioalkalivibrio paradoxus ARh 1 TaxID=713585 RepID=W0DRI6_9GAMM|nr:4-hydroxybenzoate octaprenyltransferase [Thioalkalivibrio paradoxus]AHE99475.1 4-hydroxybenzoate polyprenyltransferase [Thioalkalivibrio paradoxus ARh 1]